MSKYSSPLGVFDASIFPEVLDDPTAAGVGTRRNRNNSGSALRAATATAEGTSHPPQYESPISAINQELRRKNVVAATTAAAAAAAAAVTSGGGGVASLHPLMVGDGAGGQPLLADGIESFSDPWELSDGNPDGNGNGNGGAIFYNEPSRTAMSWGTTTVHPNQRTAASSSAAAGTSEVQPISGSAAWATNSFWSDADAGRSDAKMVQMRRMRSIGSMGASEFTAAASAALGEPQHVQALLEVTPQLRVLCPASTDMQGTGYAQPAASPHNVWLQIVAGLGGGGNPNYAHGAAGGGSGSGAAIAVGGVVSSGSSRDDPTFSSAKDEYMASRVRDRINQQAANELAGLMWVLAHEMSLEEYGVVESEVFSAVFSLVHSPSREGRMAGLAAVDALLATPSADEEKKAIKFANTLSNGLRAANGEYEFLSAVSKALGHMARRTANVDFVESEVTRALEWLSTDRSDRRLAACLTLYEFAIHAPTTFHSKTSQSTLGKGGSNEFLAHIFQAIRDPQPIVRAAAADALSQCLKILVERRHLSLTGLLCRVYFDMMDGLRVDTATPPKKRKWQILAAEEASQHGSLLVAGTLVAHTKGFMIPRLEEVCREVMKLTTHPKALMRLEVVRLIPRLARCIPKVFGRRFLDRSLFFLLESASTPTPPKVSIDLRPSAYSSIGLLVVSLTVEGGEVVGASNAPTIKIRDDPENPGLAHIVDLCSCGVIFENLDTIFKLVRKGLSQAASIAGGGSSPTMIPQSLQCASHLVEGLGDLALPYIGDLINEMFSAGLSSDLIRCLHSIAQCIPALQSEIEERILQEVSYCLAGMRDEYDPLAPFHASALEARARQNTRRRKYIARSQGHPTVSDAGAEAQGRVRITDSVDATTVRELVLSLQTLAFFGGMKGGVTSAGLVIPLLPFVQDVVAQYLAHPSSEVRRAAALTCCVLLVAPGTNLRRAGRYTGGIIEDMMGRLLQVSVSDHSPVVRLCVVRALDARYDAYLCQNHHLQELFVLLQDESVATRATALRLLGRLAKSNPAPILPVLRCFLDDLIVELQCGVDSGRGREDATRLLVVFLRAKAVQRLIPPVLESLIISLPLDGSGSPRLTSASLEAVGVLAKAAGPSFRPWLNEVVPHVLEIMRDQSSASKQRTSLRTLGQIAGSTGYVVTPYLDYPDLLTQATDILPATKRAPWSLRREVIRTLGILGALDPDRVVSVARKGGAVGGAYFEELHDTHDTPTDQFISTSELTFLHRSAAKEYSTQSRKLSHSPSVHISSEAEENLPAYLFMHEQYTMTALPLSALPPAKRLVPSDESFYPTVAIQALMRIFRDQGLVAHHGMVIQAIMFIFKSLGAGCVPYLRRVVPSLIQTVRTCTSSTLREALLKQLVLLSPIAREHLRPYIAEVFDVVEQFWSSRHLATILSLISKIAVGVPDEFRRFVPRLIKRLLMSLDDVQVSDWGSDSDVQVSNKARNESDNLSLLIRSVSNLRGVLGDYLHVLVPAFLKLADALASLSLVRCPGLAAIVLDLSLLLYRTISVLLESQSAAASILSIPAYYWELNPTIFTSSLKSSESGLPSRVVQPLVRILREKRPNSPTVGLAVIETICVCAKLIGAASWLKLYDSTVRQAIEDWQCSFELMSKTTGAPVPVDASVHERLETCMRLYNDAIDEMIRPPLRSAHASPVHRGASVVVETPQHWADSGWGISNADFSDGFDLPLSSPFHLAALQTVNSHRVNQANLQRAWDVSQRTSRDDWDEWMRRFAIQLLREAPSPALRATANLAHAYQPLARELFSAAFACCWKELSEHYRLSLVHALETAFVADVSPEILQALLNLAEFMEHDPSGGLPIDIPILANLALKCRAYAKALHYREREYSLGPTNSCVESLMNINQKLDLPEAALGVLKASSLGNEASVGNEPLEGELNFSAKHQACDMYYSVVWNTDALSPMSKGHIDLLSRQELWLARLGNWSEALSAYQEKLNRDPTDFEALLGCMRCLDAGSEWKEVLTLFDNSVRSMSTPNSTSHIRMRDDIPQKSRRKALRMCAHAAWRLGQWGDLDKFATELVGGPGLASPEQTPSVTSKTFAPKILDFDAAFYTAILRINQRMWKDAAEAIDSARRAMDGRLTALMAESYGRAYPSMVTAQTLAEMEEIIDFRLEEECSVSASSRHTIYAEESLARDRLLSVWRERLAGCRVDAEVHATIMAVRSLVLGPEDGIESTLKLSSLCDQAQRYSFAAKVLLRPLAELNADLEGPVFGFGLAEVLGTRIDFDKISAAALGPVIDQVVVSDLKSIVPAYGEHREQLSKRILDEAGGVERVSTQYRLYIEYVRHLWLTDCRDEALVRMESLSDVLDLLAQTGVVVDNGLRVSCLLELGDWKLSGAPLTTHIDERLQLEVLTSYKRATLVDHCGYRAWHAWALLNFRIAVQKTEGADAVSKASPQEVKRLKNHVVAAVQGFGNAISVGTKMDSASVQQDLLNFLSCLFQHGNLQDIASVTNECIASIALEAWLGVLPQLLARIHIREPAIRAVLHPLLTRLGEKHPQALMYPLSVLLKSPVFERKNAAESLMTTLKAHSTGLVEEALMVSSELIRVAILWLETWHEGLEDASRLYFVEGNVAGMLDILLPLHEKVESGADTWLESDFLKNFGPELNQAHLHIQEYVRLVNEGGSSVPSGTESSSEVRHTIQSEEAEAAMNRAWDIYYTFFRRVNKQLPSLTTLALSQCSPALSRARGLELGVPGSYRVDGSYVKIDTFVDSIHVITSKQRPRKITIRGSDGNDYMFLLKGHEDLRQDERVMQLFGLVNALLVRDPQTKKHDLRIQRYAISPLSHNCGLVGWVPHCDLLHSLIRDYRQSKRIPLNMENREMLKIAPDYDMLTVMQKVEVFTEALRKTTGQGNDLYEILWLKSTNSEEWLERRTKYTRSLAVMSMVGYILGLGDRHPSNLMLDKLSGRVLHIDFGDCFEVAMMRDKFPERVPFRLTRMLIKAMEVSGIEGSYRSTCERVMSVLRTSRDSLIAMLEAFVYDPLISWRLVDIDPEGRFTALSKEQKERYGSIDLRSDAPRSASHHQPGAPIELSGSNRLPDVSELANEDDELDDNLSPSAAPQRNEDTISMATSSFVRPSRSIDSRSLRMYANIQKLAANVSTESRIASLTAGTPAGAGLNGDYGFSVQGESISRSRMERSMRQRELLSLLEGTDGAAHEEALNEKALKVIRRVQDKLTGTDFGDTEPTDVTDQVQRLIIQATSSENLCQLFVGWCAFW